MKGRRILIPALLGVVASASMASGAPSKAPTAAEKKACLAANSEGQDLRAAGKLRAAREALLTCAHDPCPGPVQTDCSRWVGELDQEIPSIVVRLTRDGAEVAGASLEIDGSAAALDGKAVPLDPGKHRLIVRVVGEPEREENVVLVTGEKNRIVAISLPSQTPAKLDEPPSKVTSPEPPAAAPPAKPVWPWIFVGVSAVALGGFAYFAATGTHDVHQLDGQCAPHCDDASVDAAKRKLLVADLALGVAVVGAGLATYGFLSSTSTPRSTGASTAPSVALLPGGVFAAWKGAF